MLLLKPRHLTQEEKIFRAIRGSHRPGGVTNWQLSKIALNYTMRISELRKDGYNVVCERDRLPNGRCSNTYRYYIDD